MKRRYYPGKPTVKTGNKPRRASADKSVKPRARRQSSLERRLRRGHRECYRNALSGAFKLARELKLEKAKKTARIS